jgi:3-oxoacyl-[acyl-carrier protein] reductase
MDLMKLTDKVAVVTAASKGIGLAITRALVGEGAQTSDRARSAAGARHSPGGSKCRGGRSPGLAGSSSKNRSSG